MKKITILLLTLLFTFPAFSKDSADILQIRKIFKEINSKANPKAPEYSMFKMNYHGQSTEGGEIIAFVTKKAFKKVVVLYAGETGKREIEYYLNKNKLFFVYDVMTSYNAPIYLTKDDIKGTDGELYDPKKSTKKADRFYFKDGKLIRWIDQKGKKINPASKEAMAKGEKTLKELETLLKAIKSEI